MDYKNYEIIDYYERADESYDDDENIIYGEIYLCAFELAVTAKDGYQLLTKKYTHNFHDGYFWGILAIWLSENFPQKREADRWTLYFHDEVSANLEFKKQEDAIAFKLKWI